MSENMITDVDDRDLLRRLDDLRKVVVRPILTSTATSSNNCLYYASDVLFRAQSDHSVPTARGSQRPELSQDALDLLEFVRRKSEEA